MFESHYELDVHRHGEEGAHYGYAYRPKHPGPSRISFGMTIEAFQNGIKTVTRRQGWKKLTAGTWLLAVNKVMGFQPGETSKVLGVVEVLEVTREPLNAITDADVEREGFPGKSAEWFVQFFLDGLGGSPNQEVTRIRFRRVPIREQLLRKALDENVEGIIQQMLGDLVVASHGGSLRSWDLDELPGLTALLGSLELNGHDVLSPRAMHWARKFGAYLMARSDDDRPDEAQLLRDALVGVPDISNHLQTIGWTEVKPPLPNGTRPTIRHSATVEAVKARIELLEASDV